MQEPDDLHRCQEGRGFPSFIRPAQIPILMPGYPRYELPGCKSSVCIKTPQIAETSTAIEIPPLWRGNAARAPMVGSKTNADQ
jgi:hypothetical protein